MVSSDETEPLVGTRQARTSYGVRGFYGSPNQNTRDEISTPGLRRRRSETVTPGSRDVLSSKYESLDYDICESRVRLKEVQSSGYNFAVHKMLARWFIFFLIGLLTALIGVIIDISIEVLASYKYGWIKTAMDASVLDQTLWKPYLIWVALNVGFIFVGSFLVAYLEPIASGSGIPPIKCYLNGINVPRVVRLKTLFVKVVGVVCTVVGGLAAGKEGPMIHTGAVVAAGISQGKSTSLNLDFKIFRYFREDHEKRDFVSGGAAAGVAAAFGAPVGGVLFSLEEGSSFWNQSLTWRIFFASSVSVFTLNTLLSSYHGHPGELFYYGLLNFGHFSSIYYHFFELALFGCMGAIGGVLGAFYTFVNLKLTVFRMRYVRSRWMKVVEACLVASSTCTVAMLMIYFMSDCRPLGEDPTLNPIQMYCSDGQYSAVAALWLQNPENSVRALFHDPANSQNITTLFVFTIVYLFLSIWTYGLSASAGIFIPCLLTGAGWGRIVGILLKHILPNADWVDPGKYSLIGAAAQLGGVVRMTISLTIILIEATGNINFGLPLMVTVMVAKWVGDYFTEGFYDLHIQLGGIPLLPWDPPEKSIDLPAHEVMNYPVLTLSPVESVRTIVDVLSSETYNGFPIVDTSTVRSSNEAGSPTFGKLSGLILRSQLIVLLQNRAYVEISNADESPVPMSEFRHRYPRYKQIKDLYIPESEMNYTMDLRPYMNPSPYTVQEMASLPRIFRLFRALGLRHLIVVNDSNEVIGMVTRKDIARFRAKAHGSIEVEELKISDKL